MDIYTAVLATHSLLRWAVLVLALVVLFQGIGGWRVTRGWSESYGHLQRAFVTTIDLQLLLGLWLYIGLSPVTRTFLSDPGASMGTPQVRFFAVEHATLMVIAVIVAHVGRALSKKIEAGPRRYRSIVLNTAIVLLVIAAAIPWPFVPAARPLFRM